MKERPNLLISNEYRINDCISLHVPTLREIFAYGEQKYYGILQGFTSTPFDMMVELDDLGIDYETISQFQLFCVMMASLMTKTAEASIFFGDLDVAALKSATDVQNGEPVLLVPETDIVIDELIAKEIEKGFRKMHLMKEQLRKAGNEAAKAYLLQRARMKRKRMANQPYQSFLERAMIALVNTEEFKYDYDSVLDLNIYQFNASWQQIQRKKQWEELMTGASFGADLSKLNIEKIHWLSPVE